TGPTASPIGSPTTLVLADNLSEAAIVDAIRKGRTIVQLRGPDDPMVDLTINGAVLGEEITESAITATVHVTGGNGTFVSLVRDGVLLEEKPVTSDDATLTFTDR